MDWRSPQRSNSTPMRCLLEASHYLLRRKGVATSQCRVFFYVLRLQILKFFEHDLGFVRAIRDNDRRIVELSCQQLAYLAAKLGEEGLLNAEQLSGTLQFVEGVHQTCVAVPCTDADRSAYPPLLRLEDGTGSSSSSALAGAGFGRDANASQHILGPFYDRIKRDDDVNGLAGAPIVLPQYVPVDFLLLPKHALNLEDAIAAIRYCDRLCTLIAVQGK